MAIRSLLAAAAVAAALTALIHPVAAQQAPPVPSAENQQSLPCLWRSLPTVAQARMELAARLGEPFPVSVINRLGRGGGATLLEDCGFIADAPSFEVAVRYWRAAASWEVARTRLGLIGVDQARVDAALDAAIPEGGVKVLAEEVMLRIRGKATPVILQAMEQVEKIRGDIGATPLQQVQKRLMVEYAAARIIRRGLEAGADTNGP